LQIRQQVALIGSRCDYGNYFIKVLLAASSSGAVNNPMIRTGRLSWYAVFEFAILLFLCWPLVASGDLNSSNPPSKSRRTTALAPAPAVPLNVSVLRGGSAKISLRVAGDQSPVLLFIIRRKPDFGRLTVTGPVSGDVTYQHSGETAQKEDRFSYAAKSENGVSASVEVMISIVDAPSMFVAPESVEYGAVTMSGPIRKQITLANEGGGIIEGGLETDAPWRIEGARNYHLGAKEQQNFTVMFEPQFEQEFRGRIRYSSHPGRETSLHANAKAPFAVTPQSLELKARNNDTVRSGALEISNRTDEVQKLKIDAGERLHGDKQLELPAGATKTLELKTSADDLEPLEATVRIQSKTFHTEVVVTSSGVGAILRAEPAAITFGTLLIGESRSTIFTVQNIGGARTLAQVEPPAPFMVADADRSFSLGPSEKREVRLSFQPEAPGNFLSWLKIKSYESEVDIPVAAQVKEPQVAAKRVKPAEMNFPGIMQETPPEKTEVLSQVPPISSIVVKEVGKSSCKIEWKAPSKEPLDYRLEMRRLSLDGKGNLKIEWLPYAEFIAKKDGDHLVGRMSKLRAGSAYTIRLCSVTSAGEVSPSSSVIFFSTKPGFKISITPLRVLFLLLVVLVALVIRENIKARRSENPPAGLR
jgi:hypothetical protein